MKARLGPRRLPRRRRRPRGPVRRDHRPRRRHVPDPHAAARRRARPLPAPSPLYRAARRLAPVASSSPPRSRRSSPCPTSASAPSPPPSCCWRSRRFLIVRDRRMGERSRAVWWVVPLTALMVNIHLFAVTVPMLLGTLFLGALWERRNTFEPPDWPEGDRRAWRTGGLLAGTSLACLATPMIAGFPAAVMHLPVRPDRHRPGDRRVPAVLPRRRWAIVGGADRRRLVALRLRQPPRSCAGDVIWLLVAFVRAPADGPLRADLRRRPPRRSSPSPLPRLSERAASAARALVPPSR